MAIVGVYYSTVSLAVFGQFRVHQSRITEMNVLCSRDGKERSWEGCQGPSRPFRAVMVKY